MARLSSDTARGRDVEELRTVLALHAIAMSEIAAGVLVIDSDLRIVFFNRRCADIFGLPPHAIYPGLPLRTVLSQIADPTNRPAATMDEMWRELCRTFAGGKEFQFERRIRAGGLITLSCRPTGGGGWVCTCEDTGARHRVERELEAQVGRLTQIIENIAHGICVYDRDQRLVSCNDRYRQIFGFRKDEVSPGMTYRDILALAVERSIFPDGIATDDLLEKRAALFRDMAMSDTLRLNDGRIVELTVRPIGNEGWIAEFDDITVRMRAEETLQARNALLDAALENMAHGLCAFDEQMRVIVVNQRYLKMYGLAAADACPGTPMIELMRRSIERGIHIAGVNAEGMFADLKDRLIDNKEPALHRRLSDGRIIAVRHQPMANGGWVGTYEDITERHRAEQNIAYMARHDALTDLPNRLLFHEKMSEGLARVDTRDARLAVMCLDLDNFKAVNDSLGHPVGDQLLQAVARLLCKALHHDDTIARLGGDEFAILHPTESVADTEALARRLIDVVSKPIVIDGQEIITGLSIGIAMAPENGITSDQLMKNADLALYRAKAVGRNTHLFFEPGMDAELRARRRIEVDLRHALDAGEFHLVYQPQVRLATNQIVGMEALIRWTHPTRGLISPGEFIPVAEETGLIVQLGEFVLRQACAEATKWPETVRVAVNLSPMQIRTRDLTSTVINVLAETGIAANRLELEITEALLMQKDESVVRTLHDLRALGVQIAMDDFGTGYSSLSYLRSFPFDRIKIDRSFISGEDRSADREPIIRAIVQLGASLGIETTAEGVETVEQLQLIQRARCTEAQGFLLGRPRANWDLNDFLTFPSTVDPTAKSASPKILRRVS
jgi:diguanylate cyclase (GGDEF)-like protein/PAS domain S-box-containing protein